MTPSAPVSSSEETSSDTLRDLVRSASFAPSSHNTQCWRFRLGADRVDVLPDFARRCPVVDPDDHHLWVSLGCAVENLALAAGARGLHAEATFDPDEPAVQVHLMPGRTTPSPLADAVPERQSTRALYDGVPLSDEDLAALRQAAERDGVRVAFVTDRSGMDDVLALITEGNALQLSDPAFVAELRSWIRFNRREAARDGDGLSAAASGNPSIPGPVGRALFSRIVSADKENEKTLAQVRSSSGLAVFASEDAGPETWVEVGRAFERFALQATLLGVRTAHLNQPVEVPALRARLATRLGLGGLRPDLVVRFGRGPLRPRSPRRPLGDVLVS